MKSFRPVRATTSLLSIGWLFVASASAQTHDHIYAGVSHRTNGAPLWFQNGNVWDTNSYGGYNQAPACIFFHNNYPELYPGLYQTAPTFSALPATIFTGGPSPFAPLLGAYVELRFVSLQGPAGGALTVWDENINPGIPTVMFTIPVGTTNGTNRFNLSQGNASDPNSDPYGHIHGRRLTLNKPGLYVLGLQLVDTSNHSSSGPRHPPSTNSYFYLQAGLTISNFTRSNNVARARFGLPGFANYAFEASPVLPTTNWVTITNISGTSHSELRWVTDAAATSTNRFYRLRRTN